MFGKIGKRYARALFESYFPSELEAVRDALGVFVTLWEENATLSQVMANPAYSIEGRKSSLRDIAEKLRPGDKKFANLFDTLIENNRIKNCKEIHLSFVKLIEELKKLLSLEIVSAFDLGSDEKESITSRIAKEHGSLATVSWQVDKDIIGGLLIRAGDTVLDNSIKGALRRAQGALGI